MEKNFAGAAVWVLLLLATFALAGCGGDDGEPWTRPDAALGAQSPEAAMAELERESAFVAPKRELALPRVQFPELAPAVLAQEDAFDATRRDLEAMPPTGAWVGAGRLQEPRWEGSTATLLQDGKVLVTGGHKFEGHGALCSAELFDPTPLTFAPAAPMGARRANHTATRLADGRVLVTGGGYYGGPNLASVEIYDPATNTWTAAAPMSIGRACHTATLLDDGRVLVAGGFQPLVEGYSAIVPYAEIYDSQTDAWTRSASLVHLGESHDHLGYLTLTPLADGTVLVVDAPNSKVYDPATDSWEPTENTNVGLARPSAMLLDDGDVLVVYAMGPGPTIELYNAATREWTAVYLGLYSGAPIQSVLLATGEVLLVPTYPDKSVLYDPVANIRTPVGTQPCPISTATALSNGKALFLCSGPWGFNAIYDPAKEGWATSGTTHYAWPVETATPLDNGVVLITTDAPGGDCLLYGAEAHRMVRCANMHWHSKRHTATRLLTGEVLAVGAGRADPRYDAERYDVVADAWSPAGRMSTRRRSPTAARLADGRVLVTGGIGEIYHPLASAEIYDRAADTWTPVASMSTPRWGHIAALLPDGKVFVAGGDGRRFVNGRVDRFSLTSAEIYDPAMNTWSPASSMAAGRAWHSATVLNNRQVLIAGGEARWPVPGIPQGTHDVVALDSAELYDPATDSWTPTGTMIVGRSDFPMIVLPGGKVLVGGPNGPNTEIYDPGTGLWTPAASMPSVLGDQSSSRLSDDYAYHAFGWSWLVLLGNGQVLGLREGRTSLYEGEGVACASPDECASGICTDGRCVENSSDEAGTGETVGDPAHVSAVSPAEHDDDAAPGGTAPGEGASELPSSRPASDGTASCGTARGEGASEPPGGRPPSSGDGRPPGPPEVVSAAGDGSSGGVDDPSALLQRLHRGRAWPPPSPGAPENWLEQPHGHGAAAIRDTRPSGGDSNEGSHGLTHPEGEHGMAPRERAQRESPDVEPPREEEDEKSAQRGMDAATQIRVDGARPAQHEPLAPDRAAGGKSSGKARVLRVERGGAELPLAPGLLAIASTLVVIAIACRQRAGTPVAVPSTSSPRAATPAWPNASCRAQRQEPSPLGALGPAPPDPPRRCAVEDRDQGFTDRDAKRSESSRMGSNFHHRRAAVITRAQCFQRSAARPIAAKRASWRRPATRSPRLLLEGRTEWRIYAARSSPCLSPSSSVSRAIVGFAGSAMFDRARGGARSMVQGMAEVRR